MLNYQHRLIFTKKNLFKGIAMHFFSHLFITSRYHKYKLNNSQIVEAFELVKEKNSYFLGASLKVV